MRFLYKTFRRRNHLENTFLDFLRGIMWKSSATATRNEGYESVSVVLVTTMVMAFTVFVLLVQRSRMLNSISNNCCITRQQPRQTEDGVRARWRVIVSALFLIITSATMRMLLRFKSPQNYRPNDENIVYASEDTYFDYYEEDDSNNLTETVMKAAAVLWGVAMVVMSIFNKCPDCFGPEDEEQTHQTLLEGFPRGQTPPLMAPQAKIDKFVKDFVDNKSPRRSERSYLLHGGIGHVNIAKNKNSGGINSTVARMGYESPGEDKSRYFKTVLRRRTKGPRGIQAHPPKGPRIKKVLYKRHGDGRGRHNRSGSRRRRH